MPSQVTALTVADSCELVCGMNCFSSHRDYASVIEQPTPRGIKIAIRCSVGLALLAIGAVLGVATQRLFPPPSNVYASSSEAVSLAWHLPVADVQTCSNWLKHEGCVKPDYWYCSENDNSNEYKCCCEESLWPSQAAVAVPAGSKSGSLFVLKVIGSADVCVGQDGEHFRLMDCADSMNRTVLKMSGTGPVELASRPGNCMEAQQGSVAIRPHKCNLGMQQQFQLTDGKSGMLMWSSGGNRCLDVEGGEVTKGSKMVLKPCNFWPKEKSQQFQLAVPPKRKSGQETAANNTVEKTPTLFCTSIMLWWTYEVDLLKEHLKHKVGIFACTEWAVYSNKEVSLGNQDGKTLHNDVMNGSLKCKFGGKAHTALNTPVFRRFWDALQINPKSWRNDWIVKADPDTVFFPDRLREMLTYRWKDSQGNPGYAMWLNNCQLGLHGPLEVFSKQAFGVYHKKKDMCHDLTDDYPQEDAWLGACFGKTGVGKMDAFNLLLEWQWACNERPSSRDNKPPCYAQQVSFHPFKSVKTWFQCHRQAKTMTWASPFYPISEPPSEMNHHHA